jgi:hypothetical protein
VSAHPPSVAVKKRSASLRLGRLAAAGIPLHTSQSTSREGTGAVGRTMLRQRPSHRTPTRCSGVASSTLCTRLRTLLRRTSLRTILDKSVSYIFVGRGKRIDRWMQPAARLGLRRCDLRLPALPRQLRSRVPDPSELRLCAPRDGRLIEGSLVETGRKGVVLVARPTLMWACGRGCRAGRSD